MTPKISILAPTRGRPSGVKRFFDSVFDLADKPDEIELLLYVDNDDPMVDDYRRLKRLRSATIRMMSGEPMIGVTSMTTLYDNSVGNIIIPGNDDVVYRTQGWDTVLMDNVSRYPDEIFLMYFDDKLATPNHASGPIVSRKWCSTLGYYLPAIFIFLYQDTWLMDVAKRINRLHYIPEVVAEHLHVGHNGVQPDATYERNIVHPDRNLDHKIFPRTEELRKIDAQRLLQVIADYEKEREVII